MPYRITGDCISCGHCSVVCPQKAINDGYRDTALVSSVWQGYRITEACSECGACAAVCPVQAITKG
ncbi:MAG TPA: 4Fe-4S binding protein [Clostridia bacterium]|nr:4Fe-4S binding protein [Clostridia bacterium]